MGAQRGQLGVKLELREFSSGLWDVKWGLREVTWRFMEVTLRLKELTAHSNLSLDPISTK